MTNRKQRAIRAFSFSIIAKGAGSIGRMLVFLLVARVYSVDETGHFAFLVAIGTVAAMLADFGLSEYLSRELPASNFKNLALEMKAYRLRNIGIPLAAILAWIVAWVVDPAISYAAVGTLLYAGAIGAADFLSAIRRAYGRFDLEIIETSLPIFGALLFSAAAGLLGVPFDTFQFLLGGFSCMFVITRFIARKREIGNVRGGQNVSLLSAASVGRWFLIRGVVGWIFLEMPVVLLKVLSKERELALYAAAFRPVGLVNMPFGVLSRMFMPSLSHDMAADREQLKANVKVLNLANIFLAPAAFVACIWGGKLLLMSFGAFYLRAEDVLKVLALANIILMATPSTMPLLVVGRERWTVFCLAAASTLQIILAIWLMPDFGAMGAAICCLGAYIVGKGSQIALYMPERLNIGDRRHLVSAIVAMFWFLLMWHVEGAFGAVVSALGGIVSVVLLYRLLKNTMMFEEEVAQLE